jgi:cysteine-rich repeat protein
MTSRCAWLVLLVSSAACVTSSSVTCEDGSICPTNSTCDVEQHRCVAAGQREACDGKLDGDDCTYADMVGACEMGLCASSTCGDSLVGPGEVCDDGNLISADGCRSDCRSTETCGNGTIDFEAGEQCDCGDSVASAGCAAVNSLDLVVATCRPDCTFRCGDDQVQPGEVCDGSPPAGESCLDYGFDLGRVGCTSICTPALVQCEQFGWVSVNTGVVDAQLHGVWGVDASTVFAVGDAGVVLRWDGLTWTRQTVPTAVASASFRGVWGRTANDVFAVGLGGAMIHFDGTNWTQVSGVGTTDLYAIHGDSTHVIAVGGLTSVALMLDSDNGGPFVPTVRTSSADLHGVVIQGSDVIAVGGSGTLCRRALATSGAWTCSSKAGASDFTSIAAIGNALWVGSLESLYFGASPSDANDLNPVAGLVGPVRSLATIGTDLIVGSSRMFRITGQGTFVLSEDPVPSNALWVHALDDMWSVGAGARHFRGTTWSEAPINAPYGFEAVDAGPAGVFAVGGESMLATFVAGAWSILTVGPNRQFVAVSVGTDAVVAIQANGNILRLLSEPYTSFTETAMGAGIPFVDVWTLDKAHDTFAVSRTATESHVYRTNTVTGSFWTETSPGLPTNVIMSSIWGTADNDVYVAGRGGLIYRWNGSTWTQLPTGASAELLDIRGRSSTDIWAVGEAGTILHYDGATVTVHDSGTLTTLESVWPAGPNDVFATGGDTLLHYDGTQWVPVRDATGDYVTDIAGVGPYMFGVGRTGGTELLIRY